MGVRKIQVYGDMGWKEMKMLTSSTMKNILQSFYVKSDVPDLAITLHEDSRELSLTTQLRDTGDKFDSKS